MDQLKTQLTVVLKYGFWIASSIILLASIGIWYMTTSKLADESASQTSKIKNAIQTVSSVQNELPTHPNELSHQEMQRLIDARQDEVLQAWQTLYDRQRSILTWPVKELKQDFVNEFKDLIPIEVFVPFPTDAEEKQTFYLTRYQRYIKDVLPSVAKIANAEWTAKFDETAGGNMMGMGMGMDSGYGGMSGMPRSNVGISGAEDGPLVKWSASSQTTLLSDLFPWRGKQPSTLEVYYSQENLWILNQLLQIIADVNGDVRQPYQAKIHEIKKIGIGKSVKFGAGTIAMPGAKAGGMGMGMDMGMDMEMDMGMDMDMGMEMGGMGMAPELVDPADNRYVNASMEPITGSELRSALTSNSPTTASLAVAKRVPVMMSLNMDQRAIHELLAACGSAPLMVEINQVRVLPQSASSGSGMGSDMSMGMDGGMDGGMDMDMGMGGMGGMGGMSGMGGMGGGLPRTQQEFPYDMTVEIYGLIYIYNPPDPQKFGLELVTEDTVIDGDTETVGGQPVAPPPVQPAETTDELPTPQVPPPGPAAPAAPGTPAATPAAPPVAQVPTGPPPAIVSPVAQ